MTTSTLILLSASYVAVAALLLSLNLASSWRWPIKMAGIVLVSALYVGSYIGAKDLVGWPSKTALPDYFRLHWAVVSEPDKYSGDEGRILVWAEALDDNDLPLSVPRAHQLPYDDELAQRIERALGLVSEGQQISGTLNSESDGEEAEDQDAESPANESGADGQGDGGFQVIGPPPDLHFEQIRPPPQPAKQTL